MTTKEKIMKRIESVPESRLPELLELVENFSKQPNKTKKGKWSRFTGILNDEEARIMKEAIEEEFENIEEHD